MQKDYERMMYFARHENPTARHQLSNDNPYFQSKWMRWCTGVLSALIINHTRSSIVLETLSCKPWYVIKLTGACL
jgi:hypothetical protein